MHNGSKRQQQKTDSREREDEEKEESHHMVNDLGKVHQSVTLSGSVGSLILVVDFTAPHGLKFILEVASL